MPVFEYKVRNKEGRLVTDTMLAENERVVASKLQAAGYFPVRISLKREVALKVVQKLSVAGPLQLRLTGQDLAFFTRQLSNLLNAGLPLIKALEVLIRQTEHQRIQVILKSIRDDIREGKSLSDALARYPKVFSRLFNGMVRAGEVAGALEPTLRRLAEFIESQEDFKRQLRSAMAYPLIMALVGAVTIIFLLSYVVPKLVMMFEDIGQTLPLPTQMLIGLSRHLKNYGLFYIGGLLLVFIICKQSSRTAEGRLAFDRLRLHLPVSGQLHKKIVLARFARTLGTLIANGVPVLSSLEMVTQAVGNESVAREIDVIRQKVQDGSGLASILEKSKFFPPIIADLIAVGEEAGNLDQTLIRVADNTDREIEISLRTLISMIEPAMIVTMGMIVGFIVIAMLMPIFQMSAFVR